MAKCSRDPAGQSEFVSGVYRHLVDSMVDSIAIGPTAVSKGLSVIAVLRLVDNVMLSRFKIVH